MSGDLRKFKANTVGLAFWKDPLCKDWGGNNLMSGDVFIVFDEIVENNMVKILRTDGVIGWVSHRWIYQRSSPLQEAYQRKDQKRF